MTVQMTNIAWNGNLRSNGANENLCSGFARITVFLSLYGWIPTPERSAILKSAYSDWLSGASFIPTHCVSPLTLIRVVSNTGVGWRYQKSYQQGIG
jgi:hypothetical protein